jgi:hypothetical protein
VVPFWFFARRLKRGIPPDMKHILYFLLVVLVSCNRPQPPMGYALKARYPLTQNAGFVLVDTSLTGGKAFIQVVNNGNLITDTVILDYPGIKPIDSLPGGSRWFDYTVDRSAGMGSYNGDETEFFEVRDGRIKWLSARDKLGKETKIHLLLSLKSWWKWVPGKEPQIIEADCRPDFSAGEADSIKFKIIYTRYQQKDSFWTKAQREEPGFIEFESEVSSLPDSLFPVAR